LLFGWLVADGWCWFVLREKYYWLVADKPSEQGVSYRGGCLRSNALALSGPELEFRSACSEKKICFFYHHKCWLHKFATSVANNVFPYHFSIFIVFISFSPFPST
jgi:hypothetical protein